MKPQLNSETDDEYFDDPIKLFDTEHDRVHFGSQGLQVNSLFESTKLNQLTENNTFEIDTESPGVENSVSENICERDCLPLRIKLIDCSKYPWYYKKYSQQILEKINISVSVSDTDSEMDIELLDELNDDCFIIDDIVEESNNQTNKESIPSWSSVTFNSTTNKKRKEDNEIQKALSQKYIETVDFKRNKGLIGMKITQKYIKEINLVTTEPNLNKTTVTTTVTSESKKDKVIAKPSINASNKAVSNIGTIRITPILPKVPTSSNKTETTNKKPVKHQESTDVLIKERPVILEKQSKKLSSNDSLDCLNVIKKEQDTKCQEQFPDNRNSKDFNKKENSNFCTLNDVQKSSSLSKVENYSRTVKNIKNTTMYKKKVLKDFRYKLYELLTLKSNKKETLPCEANNVNINANEDNSIKIVEKKDERSSPILTCSKLVKNNKTVNERVKAVYKQYTSKKKKSVNHSDGMHQVANKPISGNCNNSGNIQGTLIENTIGSKKLNAEVKDIDERGETIKTLNKRSLYSDVVVKSNVTQSCSSSHTNTSMTQSSYSIDANVYNNLPINPIVSSDPIHFTHPTNNMISHIPNSNGINYSKNIKSDNIISGSNEVAYDQVNDIGSTVNNITTPLSTTTVSSTQCKPTSIPIKNYDEFMNTNNLPKKSDCGNETILNHLNNGVSHNFYASAIILKPSKPQNISCRPRFDPSTPNTRRLPQIRFQMQPRFYHNPYKSYHCRTPYNQEQRFVPQLTNCTMTNYYRFPTPYFNRCNAQFNSQSFQSSHTGSRMPNNFQGWNPRNECPRNFFPPRLPISTLQTNANPFIETEPKLVTQQKKVAKTMINSQQDLNTNEVNAAIESRHPRYSTHNVISEENNNLVTSKTKMLELLDGETNNSIPILNKNNNDIEKQLEYMFKVPEISSQPEITINSDYRKNTDQQNGYSPPILPIPTFEKVLDRVKINQNQRNAEVVSHVAGSKQIRYVKQSNTRTISYQSQKNVKKRDIKTNKEITHTNDCYNRVVSGKSKESIRKQGIKKISLEEYKKRTLSHGFEGAICAYNGKCDKSDSNKRRRTMCNQPRTRVDKHSAESDHGYDSDSTVILI